MVGQHTQRTLFLGLFQLPVVDKYPFYCCPIRFTGGSNSFTSETIVLPVKQLKYAKKCSEHSLFVAVGGIVEAI